MEAKKLIAISLAVILPLSAIKAGDSSGISVGATNPYGGTIYYSGGGFTLSDMALASILIVVSMAVALQVKKVVAEPQGNDQVALKPPTCPK